MERGEASRKRGRWQGCMLAAGGLLLSCLLLVIGPTGYAVYRYRAAQVYSGDVVAASQPVMLPTQRADVYTLTLQPQASTTGGMTLGYALRDSFGRVLAASTDYYTAGCPSGSPPNETCPAQSRDFQFNDSLGGPVQLTLQSTQANIHVAVQVRDESAGGIFASGSLFLFGAFFGCGLLLWMVIAALIVLFVRRFEQLPTFQRQEHAKILEDIPEQQQHNTPNKRAKGLLVSSSLPSAPKAHDAQEEEQVMRGALRNEFVVALLTDLQRRRYSLTAWGRFLADSWRKSRATIQEHPKLSRSWVFVSLFVGGLTACSFSVIWLFEGERVALRVLPALVIGLLLQQGDVYVHLGLNWRPSDGLFREQLGIPTLLTLARGVMANLLLAHLLSGVNPLLSVILGAYLIGLATDIADGQIARRTNWQTRLGSNLDGEADLFLSSSIILCALFSGVLPAWIAAIMLLRFAVPVAGALLSYFVAIRQIDFTHTLWGRGAGIAQAVFLISLLAPNALARVIFPLYLPLLLLTLVLLILAPVIEIRRNVASWRLQKREMRPNAG